MSKSSCINCSIFICNRVACSLAELDESTDGWIAQQSVGYFQSCASEIIENDQEQPPNKKPRTEINEYSTDNQVVTKKVNVLIHNCTRVKRHQTIRRRKSKKVAGRKATWKEANIDDMIDIIVNDESFSKNLIFTNVKKQKNNEVYNRILKNLQERYSQYTPPSSFPLTVPQMRTNLNGVLLHAKRSVLPSQPSQE